jgi:hypothetical protein
MSVQLAVVVPDPDGDDGHGVGGLDDGKMSQSQLSKSSSRPWAREVMQSKNTFRKTCIKCSAAIMTRSARLLPLINRIQHCDSLMTMT